MFGVHNLGVDFIIGPPGTEALTRSGVAAVGVAGLNHEFLDHSVKKRVVVIAFLYKFQEVVAMFGRIAVQKDCEIAGSGGNLDFGGGCVRCVLVGHGNICIFRCSRGTGRATHCKDGNAERCRGGKKEFFHC